MSLPSNQLYKEYLRNSSPNQLSNSPDFIVRNSFIFCENTARLQELSGQDAYSVRKKIGNMSTLVESKLFKKGHNEWVGSMNFVAHLSNPKGWGGPF